MLAELKLMQTKPETPENIIAEASKAKQAHDGIQDYKEALAEFVADFKVMNSALQNKIQLQLKRLEAEANQQQQRYKDTAEQVNAELDLMHAGMDTFSEGLEIIQARLLSLRAFSAAVSPLDSISAAPTPSTSFVASPTAMASEEGERADISDENRNYPGQRRIDF